MQRLRDNIPPGVRRTALLALTTALMAVFAFSGSVLAKSENGNGDKGSHDHGKGHGNDQPGANGVPPAGGQGENAQQPSAPAPNNPGNGAKGGGKKGGSKNGGGKGSKEGGGKGNGGGSNGSEKAPSSGKSPSAKAPGHGHGGAASPAAKRLKKFTRKLTASALKSSPSKSPRHSKSAPKTSADIGWARRLSPNCKLLAGDRHGTRHGDKRGHGIGLGHRIVECSAPEPVCEAVVRVERHKAKAGHGSKPGHQRGRGHFRTVKVECPPPAEVAGPPAPLPLPVIEPVVTTAGQIAVPADTIAPRARIAGRFSRCIKRRVRVSAFSFDLSGVAKIEFYIGSRLIRRIAQPRASHRITLRTGRRSGTLRMVVTDTAGHTTTVKRTLRACPAKVTRRVQPQLTG